MKEIFFDPTVIGVLIGAFVSLITQITQSVIQAFITNRQDKKKQYLSQIYNFTADFVKLSMDVSTARMGSNNFKSAFNQITAIIRKAIIFLPDEIIKECELLTDIFVKQLMESQTEQINTEEIYNHPHREHPLLKDQIRKVLLLLRKEIAKNR